MSEASGKNNPRAQKGKHASQPLSQSSSAAGSNNPRHSQPLPGNRGQNSLPAGSNNPRAALGEGARAPRHSKPLPAPESYNSGPIPSLPAMGDVNPYSRGATAGDYAQDRRRKKRKRVLLGVLAAVLVVVMGGAATAFAYINQLESNMNDEITPEIKEALEAPAAYEGGTFYMLLMGTDGSKERSQTEQYAGDNFRSDSMILARVDPQNKKVTMVSLHRDTEIEIEGYGLQKLNASYAIGGPAAAIKTVSQMAGVPISHYAEINFDGFKDIVDALGGVEVDVPMEINDSEAGGHVSAGKQTLNGDEALILCRSRHAYDEYGDGDRYRAANQRMVLGAIAKKILSADVGTMASTVEALSKYVTTDLKIADILALANSMQGLDPSTDIYSAMEPTESEYRNDTWYERLDVEGWNTMMNRMKQGLPPTEEDEVDELNGTVLASVGDGAGAASDAESVKSNASGKATFSETRTGKVTVKNGNGTDGVGAEALERIKPLGYTADASNANSFNYDETVVVFDTPDQRVYAEELIDALGCGRAVQNKNGEYQYEGDFLILIGSDWH